MAKKTAERAARGNHDGAGTKAKARGEKPPGDEKETVVSFRVDRHLAEALTKLPDRSAFIRRAILGAFYPVCPACQGRGVLPEPSSGAIQDFMASKLPLTCECCGFAYPPSKEHKRGAYTCKGCSEHEHEAR